MEFKWSEMRKRKEIEEQSLEWVEFWEAEDYTRRNTGLILEVLLDIRDALKKP